jgi:hypothetical protein
VVTIFTPSTWVFAPVTVTTQNTSLGLSRGGLSDW